MAIVQISNQNVAIARESDFQEFLTYADVPSKFKLRKALEAQVRAVGTVRTHLSDLLRKRLSQLRADLA